MWHLQRHGQSVTGGGEADRPPRITKSESQDSSGTTSEEGLSIKMKSTWCNRNRLACSVDNIVNMLRKSVRSGVSSKLVKPVKRVSQ